MLTEASYHGADEHGYIRSYKEPQQLWMNVVLFHEEYDYSIQQREFTEQADYFRYIAKLQQLVTENKEIESESYFSEVESVKA